MSNLKASQLEEKNCHLGVNCFNQAQTDMKEQHVFEGVKAKKQQIQLATQVAKMILKIDDIITPANYD